MVRTKSGPADSEAHKKSISCTERRSSGTAPTPEKTSPIMTLVWRLVMLLALSTPVTLSYAAIPSPIPSTTDSKVQQTTDGYLLTVEYWKQLEKDAEGLQAALLAIHNQATATFPSDMLKRRAYLTEKLAE